MAGKVTRDHHSLRRNLKLNGNYISNDGGDEGLSVSDAGAVSTSGALTVGGALTVSGTTTTLNTQTVEVEDNILQLNTTQASPDTATAATSGISIYRGNGVTQASLIFDDADDTWDLTNNIAIAGDIDLEGDIDVNGTANLDAVDIDGAVNMAADLTMGANILMADDTSIGISDSDERIEFDASGDISVLGASFGVGISAPISPLHLYEDTSNVDATAGLTIEQDGTGDAILQFLTTGAQRWVMGIDNSVSGDPFVISSDGDLNSNARFSIVASSGNVGIGTSSPVYELEVEGDFKTINTVTGRSLAPLGSSRNKKIGSRQKIRLVAANI